MKNLLTLLLLLLCAGCGSSEIDETVTTTPSVPSNGSSTDPSVRFQGVPVIFRVTGDWGSGFGAELTITNVTSQPLVNWTVDFDAPFAVDTAWNGRLQPRPSGFRVTPQSWNSTIAPGASVTVGFNGRPGGPPATPTNITLNGQSVSLSSPEPTSTPAPQPTPSPTSSPGLAQILVTITQDWGSGFGATLTLQNSGSQPLEDWRVRFTLEGPGTVPKVTSLWNAEILEVQGATVTVGPSSWNRTLAPGAKLEIGFNGSPGGTRIVNATLLTDSPSSTPSPSTTPAPLPTSSPSPGPGLSNGTVNGPGLVAYFAEWGIYDRGYFVNDIPADALKVVNYAFARIEDGEVAVFDRWAALEKSFPGDTPEQPMRGNFHQLALLKARHPHLKVMISVGGWTLSSAFSDVALTPASRERFARSAVSFVKRYGFDGLDIDWEYPVAGGLESNRYRPEDRANYTLLLQELRRQLDAEQAADGARYLLSIAAPAGPDKSANLELAAIGRTVDWINVMTYDFHGAWENVTNHHAPLFRNPQDPTPAHLGYTVEASLQPYLATVPAHKIAMGIPAYGRSWRGSTGLFQAAAGPGQGSWEPGVMDYKDIISRQTSQTSLYRRVWDASAQAPLLVAPTLDGLVVSYEDAQSLAAKIAFAREKGLGGFLVWELSGDLPTSREALWWQRWPGRSSPGRRLPDLQGSPGDRRPL